MKSEESALDVAECVDPSWKVGVLVAEPKDLQPDGPLDELDRALLEVLQGDARISNADLAARVGLAPSTTHARVRSLRDRGVITEFLTSVDQRKLGLGLQALIGVTLRGGARQANITDFAESVRDLPGVLQVFFLGGTDDFMVHIAVADTAALRAFVVDHLSSRPGVASTRTSVVFDYHRNGVAASFQ